MTLKAIGQLNNNYDIPIQAYFMASVRPTVNLAGLFLTARRR